MIKADVHIDMVGPAGRAAIGAAQRAAVSALAAEAAARTIQAGPNTSTGINGIPLLANGSGNSAFGNSALSKLSEGDSNTAVGDQALRDVTTGGDSVAVGAGAERTNTTGGRNVSVGAGAGLNRTKGSDNLSAGFGAQGQVTQGGSFNVALGREALPVYEGDDATAVGALALLNAKGIRNTALGSAAGGSIVEGQYNVFVGYAAGSHDKQKKDASNSLVLGYGAYSDADDQIALGNDGHTEMRMFGMAMLRKSQNALNLFMGNAGNQAAVGAANVVIGHTAGFSLANADSNTLIGYEAGYYLIGGGNNVAIGRSALLAATTARDCTAVGAGALNRMVDGVGTTAVGRYSLQCLEDGGNNTAVGDASGRNLHGEQNCLMGYGTMRYNYAGSYNCVIGQGALYNAGKAPGTQPEDGGDPGPLVRTNGAVTGPHNPSSYNAIVGHLAFELTSGGGHTGVGAHAGRSLTGGQDTIFIGRDAGFGPAQKADASRSIVIGVGTTCTRDDEIVIGNSTHTHVTIAGVTFTRAQLLKLLDLVK